MVGSGNAAEERKYPVLPVMAMAVEIGGGGRTEGVGGPVIDKQEGEANSA
jgi:hypothetical protein